MKQLILFTIILFFLSTCTDRKNNHYGKFEIKKQIELNLIEYPDVLGISMQLLKQDSLILINDFRGDSLIHVFDIKNLQLIRKLFSVGNGPNEFISPISIELLDSSLYIFSRQTFFLYSIPISNILEDHKSVKKRFQVSSKANHLFPLSDSIFISSGHYQKRYALIDKDGTILKEFGEYPAYWKEEKDIPTNVRAMFHQTRFERHPENQRFLTYSSHVVEIYDNTLNPNNPVLVTNILMGEYNYTYTNGDVLSTKRGMDVERGVVYATCSHEHIYVVYDPNKKGENNGSQIYVYDWNGNPVELLQFDKTIRCLFIDEKEMKGYVIAENPDDSLMYFDL